MSKRIHAQSALEYMMTYGWAILIIVIVAVVLYSLGLFSPSSAIGNTVTGFAGLGAPSVNCWSNGTAEVTLGDNLGQTINITNITFEVNGVPVAYIKHGAEIAPNAFATFSAANTNVCPTTLGARYSFQAIVQYTEPQSVYTTTQLSSGTAAGTTASAPAQYSPPEQHYASGGLLAYVTNYNDNNITVINLTTDKIVANITGTGYYSDGVAISQNGKYAYIADENNLSIINTETNKMIKNITLGGGYYPDLVALTPNGKVVYVTDGNVGTIFVINLTSGKFIANITDNNNYGVAMSPDGDYAYVTAQNGVSVINTATNEIISTITSEFNGDELDGAITINPAGTLLYLGVSNRVDYNVSVLNLTTDKVISNITVFDYPSGIALDPTATTLAYVGGYSSDNNISVINLTLNKVIGNITVSAYANYPNPEGIAITPDGKLAYIADSNENNVSVINLTSEKVIDNITLTAYDNYPYPAEIAIFTPTPEMTNFTETGLPSDTPWTVEYDDTYGSNSSTKITFFTFPGTFSYFVETPVVGDCEYIPLPASGSATAGSSVAISFSCQSVTSFFESGLPSETNWSVDYDSVLEHSISPYITFSGSSGSYSVNPVSVYGCTYSPVPVSGSVATYSEIDITFSLTYCPTYAYVSVDDYDYPESDAYSERVFIINTSDSQIIGSSPYYSPFYLDTYGESNPDIATFENSSGAFAYVTGVTNTGELSVLNLYQNYVEGYVTDVPSGEALSSSNPITTFSNSTGTYAYVAAQRGLSIIKTANGASFAVNSTQYTDLAVMENSSGTFLYATEGDSGRSVDVYNTANNKFAGAIDLSCENPDYIAFAENTTNLALNPTIYAYVTCDGAVYVIDTSDDDIVHTVDISDFSPYGIVIPSENASSYAYVTNEGGSDISIINISTYSHSNHLALSGGIKGISSFTNSTGTYLYILNYYDESIDVFDTSNDAVIDTISFYPLSPSGVAMANYTGLTNALSELG